MRETIGKYHVSATLFLLRMTLGLILSFIVRELKPRKSPKIAIPNTFHAFFRVQIKSQRVKFAGCTPVDDRASRQPGSCFCKKRGPQICHPAAHIDKSASELVAWSYNNGVKHEILLTVARRTCTVAFSSEVRAHSRALVVSRRQTAS